MLVYSSISIITLWQNEKGLCNASKLASSEFEITMYVSCIATALQHLYQQGTMIYKSNNSLQDVVYLSF